MENTIVGPNENAKDSGLRLISTMGVNTDGHVPFEASWTEIEDKT